MLLTGIAHGIILIAYKQLWRESALTRENKWSLWCGIQAKNK